MGTKTNPGHFDCYRAAEPNEPMFILLARDPQAAFLVRRWAWGRKALIDAGLKPATDMPMVTEALQCADNMDTWRAEFRPNAAPSVTDGTDARITELLAANNALLERARSAEDRARTAEREAATWKALHEHVGGIDCLARQLTASRSIPASDFAEMVIENVEAAFTSGNQGAQSFWTGVTSAFEEARARGWLKDDIAATLEAELADAPAVTVHSVDPEPPAPIFVDDNGAVCQAEGDGTVTVLSVTPAPVRDRGPVTQDELDDCYQRGTRP